MGRLKKLIAAQQGAFLASGVKTITTETFALTSTGSQRIDTGIYPNADQDWELYGQFNSVQSYNQVMGCIDTSNTNRAYLCIASNTSTLILPRWDNSGTYHALSGISLNLNTWSKAGSELSINAESTTITDPMILGDATLYLFDANADSTSECYFTLHHFKIWPDSTRSTLSTDMIAVPAGWRAEEGAGIATENCMWCKVRKEYFLNQGTGTFGIEQIS